MFNDLRDYIEQANNLGLVTVIEGADWNIEMGAITELSQSKPDGPLILFDKIKDYPPGYRVITNFVNNYKLICLAYGLSLDLKGLEIVKAFRERLKEKTDFPSTEEMESGPVEENILTGDDVDLWKFPAAKWHEFDGGRYIGTGTVVITRDPDTGLINLGTFRVQVHDKNTVIVHIEKLKRHTHLIREKYWSKGKSCPVAVVCGSDPRLMIAAGSKLSKDMGGEYDLAAWLRRRPVEVIQGKTVDLPIPALAEIVLEGEMLPPGVDDRIEGPFAEGKGFYDGGGLEPVTKINCILHRNNPIILGAPPLCGAFELRYSSWVNVSGVLWEELDRHVPGIKGVWFINESRNPMLAVSIEQQYPDHVKEATMTILNTMKNTSTHRSSPYVILVDDDIDPFNLHEVMFAIGTRCHPEKGIEIIRGIDDTLSSDKPSKCIINACKPYNLIKEYPRMNKCSAKLIDEASKKWGHLLFKRGE